MESGRRKNEPAGPAKYQIHYVRDSHFFETPKISRCVTPRDTKTNTFSQKLMILVTKHISTPTTRTDSETHESRPGVSYVILILAGPRRGEDPDQTNN